VALLEAQEIHKYFANGGERHTVLGGVSLQVEEGQFVTLLGPSGCGKTTLLTIIAGFQKASAGSIRIDGRPVKKSGPDRGFVFQNYALFPWMSIRDNILYPMKQLKVPSAERERRLSELLELAGLEGKDKLYPHQLSGGMKQRTAVIRALACRPRILLMDEPLGAVDFQMRQNLQEELEDIFLRDRATVLMVTHDVEEAVYMSDRVVVMGAREGEIKADLGIPLTRPRERRSSEHRWQVNKIMDVLTNRQDSEGEEETSLEGPGVGQRIMTIAR